MVQDKIENLKNYIPISKVNVIEEFLKDISADMVEGTYEIDGEDIFARIMSYETKLPEVCEIEAHNIYCDIQFSLIGSEGISIYQRDNLIEKSFDKANDFISFQKGEAEEYISVENKTDYFTLIFPREAHRPQESKDGMCRSVKKGVIKIRESCFYE